MLSGADGMFYSTVGDKVSKSSRNMNKTIIVKMEEIESDGEEVLAVSVRERVSEDILRNLDRCQAE